MSREVSHMTLSHMTLSHMTLSHMTLSHMTLSHMTLSHVTLSHVTLSHVTLSHVTLSHVTLSHVTLSHVTLSHVTLSYVTMSYVTLSHVTLKCSLSHDVQFYFVAFVVDRYIHHVLMSTCITAMFCVSKFVNSLSKQVSLSAREILVKPRIQCFKTSGICKYLKST